jgi:DNA-3-methyladenine glycosylase I
VAKRVTAQTVKRCPWPGEDPLYCAYHDEEWGVPEYDDWALYEKLVLDGFQAGLSWITILRKRQRYREVFAGFDPAAVARFGRRDVAALLLDPGIVRNRAKVEGTVRNARALLELVDQEGSFDRYVWGFVGGKPLRNRWRTLAEVPAETAESRALGRDLKRRGFTFVGPTICYAFMQAVGLVNDHVTTCFLHGVRRASRRS